MLVPNHSRRGIIVTLHQKLHYAASCRKRKNKIKGRKMGEKIMCYSSKFEENGGVVKKDNVAICTYGSMCALFGNH